MSTKKVKIAIVIVIILSTILFNQKIMPLRQEITELETIKLIGIDSINEGKYKIETTISRLHYQSSSPQMGSINMEEDEVSEELSIKSTNFNNGMRSAETYTDKKLTSAHIRYFLFGETFFNDDVGLKLDFLVRNFDTRLNAGVYIIRNNTAKEFINQVQNKEYSIDLKLTNMEKSNVEKSVVSKVIVMDLVRMLLNKDVGGLIPTLKIIPNKDSNRNEKNLFESSDIVPEKSNEVFFDFDGYAVIQNNVLIGNLDRSESITCNIIKNTFDSTNMEIESDMGLISFGILDSKTKISFKFENDKLKKVIIKTSFLSNFEEILSKENVFDSIKIEELERLQEEKMKSAIEKIIKKVIEYKCDFLEIKNKVEVKHPYKFKKIEENWNEQLCNAEFEIVTKCNINRTYDILMLHEKEGN